MSDASQTVDVAVVGRRPGRPGGRPRPAWPAGHSVVVRGGPRPGRRADCSTSDSDDGKVVEVGRPVDRPDPGPDGRAGARDGRRHVPHLRGGREPERVARHADAATAARSRGSTPLVLVDVEQAQKRAEPDGAQRCRWTARGRRAKARQWDAMTRAHLDGAQRWRTQRRQGAAAAGHRVGVGRRSPRTSRCCTCSSTSTPRAAWRCCSTPRAAPRTAASWAARSWCRIALAERLGDEVVLTGRAGAPDRARRRRRDGAGRRR